MIVPSSSCHSLKRKMHMRDHQASLVNPAFGLRGRKGFDVALNGL